MSPWPFDHRLRVELREASLKANDHRWRPWDRRGHGVRQRKPILHRHIDWLRRNRPHRASSPSITVTPRRRDRPWLILGVGRRCQMRIRKRDLVTNRICCRRSDNRSVNRGHPAWDTLHVSRGPSRRVQRLKATGEISERLLAAADHEADLLAHPYIGVEHVELARLRLAGRVRGLEEIRRRIPVGVRRWWWRPRGRRSALRRRGLEQTQAASRAAGIADRSGGHGVQ